MKNIIFVLTLLLSINFCLAADSAKKSQELKVATYNIRYGSMDNSPTGWPQRKNALLKQITEVAPDIAGMQEVLIFQYKDIDTAFDNYSLIGCGREDGVCQGEFSPIMYNNDKYTVCESGVFWLSETPNIPGSMSWNTACTRICTWARFIDLQNDTSFYMYNTHLDHVSDAAKINGIKLIISNIENRTFKNDPYILTGDFNLFEGSDIINFVTDNKKHNKINFTETYRKINPDKTDISTFNGFKDDYNKGKIDYIFTSPEFEITGAGIEEHKVDGIFPSDHFPVWATLKK